MNTAIPYYLEPLPEIVFQSAVTIRRQAGKYFLMPPTAQSDGDPIVTEKVLRALGSVVKELNGE